jgi:NADP-dependent 3-hydroxy acid dehydrogenase YdfG
VEKPLDGKVAVVTGASSGIGAACAQQLAAAGAQVAMAARRHDKLTALQQQIQRDGGVAICVQCDVTDRAQVRNHRYQWWYSAGRLCDFTGVRIPLQLLVHHKKE